jgi:uncharacterized protein DUF397
MADLTATIWRKSTRSGNGGSDCVEVAKNLSGVVGVRDSKDRSGPVLAFDPQAWTDFIGAVKNGEFDLTSDRTRA